MNEILKRMLNSILICNRVGTIEFKNYTFHYKTGGIPNYIESLKESIIDSEENFAYENINGSVAKWGSITIKAYNTHLIDSNGDEIYFSDKGIFFVVDYQEGNPERFDSTDIREPIVYVHGKGHIRLNQEYIK